MGGLVPLEQVDALSQSRHDIVALKHVEVAIIAGLRQYALDNHVIGDTWSYLGSRRKITQEGIRGLWKFFVEQLAVAWRVETVQVTMLIRPLVEEAPKELGVLGLLPQEGGQKHLLLD